CSRQRASVLTAVPWTRAVRCRSGRAHAAAEPTGYAWSTMRANRTRLEDTVPVDPQIAAILQLLASSGAPSLASGTPQQARAAFRFTTVDMRDPATLVGVASIDNQQIPGPAGSIPVRIYRPSADGPVPTIVFFHGGGFVIGDLDTHDDHGRLLCR